MPFQAVSNPIDFIALEHEILRFWQETHAFDQLRALRAGSSRYWSFLDGPITANNPMGVHHAWGRTYKDIFQRFKAMQGYDQRWQNGFDCQGLWVEVNVEKELGFKSKRDIEAYGLAEFVKLCKMRVLEYAALMTEQSIRLGYWTDWNDPQELRRLRALLAADPMQPVTTPGVDGTVTDTVEQIVGRLGMPELGGSYFTFSNENNYQIWGFLRRCYEKGWLYKGTDVMPWCYRCGTGISQHEIVTDGYRELTHESVYVRFPLVGREREALLVWTTTPWTLTSNVAAAVGHGLTYVKVRQDDGWIYYLAKGTLKTSLKGSYEVLEELPGSALIGWKYSGPFDQLPSVAGAFARHTPEPYTHRVIGWKDVGEAEGTGIVHIAPGCGAEDFALSKEYHLPVVAPLDENGVYMADFDWLAGKHVTAVTPAIFDHLRADGFMYRVQRYTHRYPTCWRCGEELIFRLVDEWFISMGQVYDKPREALTTAEKEASLRYQIMDIVGDINWIPGFGYDREMDWLRNMHDWMISKKRYWGLALPIWVCDVCGHFDVIGSDHELKARAVAGWDTFQGRTPHRPYIDVVKIACTACGGQATRIKDVGNPWLDAGIVAFSTMHFREQPEYWAKWFPADFITESFPGQFRNWFYSLLAQSTVLARRAPFRNVLGYATLLAEDGREMHKSWGNSIEFNEAADTMGADVMRWLYANHRPESNLLFGYKLGDETRRRFLITLWNVYAFLVSYANLDGWEPEVGYWSLEVELATPRFGQRSPVHAHAQLDQWIVARLDETTLAVTRSLEEFDSMRACVALEALLDDLSNWYVRRSRRRFWKSGADDDKRAAYATLYHVLVTLTKLLAPFVPFVAEAMYQNLVRGVDAGAALSVHHCEWPTVDAATLDRRLLDKMGLAVTVAGLGRAARATADVKLRQPLARAQVHVTSAQARADLEELVDVLSDELNVKEIEVVAEVGELVDYKLLPNNRRLGPRLGKSFPAVRTALALLDPVAAAHTLQSGGTLTIETADDTFALSGEDVLLQTEARGRLAVASDRGVTVAVDTTLAPALVTEGYARDLVRAINALRKEAGFAVDDRIDLAYLADGESATAFERLADTIRRETLTVRLQRGTFEGTQQVVKVGDEQVTLTVRRTA